MNHPSPEPPVLSAANAPRSLREVSKDRLEFFHRMLPGQQKGILESAYAEVSADEDHFSAIEKTMSDFPTSFFSMIRRIRGTFRLSLCDADTLELLRELVEERRKSPECAKNRDFKANLEALVRALDAEDEFRHGGFSKPTTEPVREPDSEPVRKAVAKPATQNVTAATVMKTAAVLHPKAVVEPPLPRPSEKPEPEPFVEIESAAEPSVEPATKPEPATEKSAEKTPRVFRRNPAEGVRTVVSGILSASTPREKGLLLGNLPEVRNFFERKIRGRAFATEFARLSYELRRKGPFYFKPFGIDFEIPKDLGSFAKLLGVAPYKKALSEVLGYENPTASNKPKKRGTSEKPEGFGAIARHFSAEEVFQALESRFGGSERWSEFLEESGR
jgi:hypothetical protein